jgi:tRNA uridine 5-carbamoylmethylation protein Kti12
MKLIIIYGAPAVGKLTTANVLSKKTKYPILHNHATIDLVTNYFPFNSRPFFSLLRKVRLDIINEMLTEKTAGLIWTTGLPNTPDNRAFYKKLDNLVKKNGGTTYYVKLVCDPVEQKKRVLGIERKKYKKLSTVKDLTKMMKDVDFSTKTPEKNTIIIDNTNLSLQKVVSKIIKFTQENRK